MGFDQFSYHQSCPCRAAIWDWGLVPQLLQVPVQHPQALCLCPPQLGLAVLLSISPVPRALICVVFVGQESLFLPAVTNSWVKLLLLALALPSCCVQLRPFLVYLRPLSNDVSVSLSFCCLCSIFFLPIGNMKPGRCCL